LAGGAAGTELESAAAGREGDLVSEGGPLARSPVFRVHLLGGASAGGATTFRTNSARPKS